MSGVSRPNHRAIPVDRRDRPASQLARPSPRDQVHASGSLTYLSTGSRRQGATQSATATSSTLDRSRLHRHRSHGELLTLDSTDGTHEARSAVSPSSRSVLILTRRSDRGSDSPSCRSSRHDRDVARGGVHGRSKPPSGRPCSDYQARHIDNKHADSDEGVSLLGPITSHDCVATRRGPERRVQSTVVARATIRGCATASVTFDGTMHRPVDVNHWAGPTTSTTAPSTTARCAKA